ncbi:SAV_915 family protein [Streptomyces sp. NPDC088196]|uniref:SAV_915 family protein n=1 Tax=Streptomyces sp. NPDC088196 TaxID=3154868 RepID=UPI00344CEFED
MSPVDQAEQTDHAEGLKDAEDSEPAERFPAGLLYVPVRSGPVGCTARFFRTPLGGRTAVGFTSAARLAATLGAEQASIRLSEPALRALAAPLGVTDLTVDPQFSAPAADRTAAAVRERENSWRRWHPQHVGALRVTGAAAVVACLNLLIG